MELPPKLTAASVRGMRRAILLSLAVGGLMLAGKVGAYLYTGSSAILSDAAESVVHVAAVAFAAFSLWLSLRPADDRFRYGYERVAYFSAGFEGALIVVAAVYIYFAALRAWWLGIELANLGAGTVVVLAAGALNLWLGWGLVRMGRRTRSLVLEANGRHVLTDSWTSFGVVGGLLLVQATGWRPFDPLCAIAVASNILWSGGRLVWRSVSGLMDYADPAMAEALRAELNAICAGAGVTFHGLRFRNTGYCTRVEVHLLFPDRTPVGDAHRIATVIEERLCAAIDTPLEVATHLESADDHQVVHRRSHYTGV